MTAGSLVVGLLNGLTIGLLAAGLVLVYKANRFLNLAHAQMGTLSALLLAKLVLDWSWPYWAAFVVAIVVGVATGVVVDRLFVRRLRAKTTSTVSLLLLSIGVAQLLLAVTFIHALGPNPSRLAAHFYPQPFDVHVSVGGVVLDGSELLTAVLAPLLIAALAVFLRFTPLGKRVRAAASNADAASLCGINTDLVSTLVWAMAGGLSAVSAVLQAPSQPNFNVAALGPSLLLLTLGAAAVGAFVSLPLALAGGLLFGVVEQVVSARAHGAGDGQLAVVALVLLVVLVRGRSIGASFAGGDALEERPRTKVPEGLRSHPLVRHERVLLLVVSTAVAAVLPLLPYFDTNAHRFQLCLVLIYSLIAVSLTMLVGWTGQVSLGHFAVVGMGAFLAARLVPNGWSLPAVLLVAALVGALAMVVVGVPALRVPGLALTVTTLGLAVAAPVWLFRQAWFGSERPFGIDLPAVGLPFGLPDVDSQLGSYYAALVLLVLATLAVGALRRSVPGRSMIAVRDNEPAAAAFGFTPATVKLAALATSGAFTATAGVLWAIAWKVVSPLDFAADLSLPLLALPVIGGLGSVAGAVAAAVTVYAPAYFLSPLVRPLFGRLGANVGFQLALGGAGIVLTLLAYPAGIAGAVQRQWERVLARLTPRQSAPAAAAPPGGRSGRPRRWDEGARPLEVEGIDVRFGPIKALDGAAVRVEPGEIVGLIGPNGAGKTTLMNVISGVLEPSAGSVRLFGREVRGMPADTRATLGLGRTFQDARLFAGLTVTETIELALSADDRVDIASSMTGMPWARETERRLEAEAAGVLDRFGLTAWRDALTSELSTGTRRICDLAAQFAARPGVLLLDEPTAGVAQREAEAFGPLVRSLQRDVGCSILLVEHDMPLLMGLCDRVIAMDSGRVIAEGTPSQIRNNPAVVASYLGTDDTAIHRSGAAAPRSAGTAGLDEETL